MKGNLPVSIHSVRTPVLNGPRRDLLYKQSFGFCSTSSLYSFSARRYSLSFSPVIFILDI